MFSPRKNLVFVFPDERIVSLHMFFVFFPINVLYLDSGRRVVEKARLKPFGWYKPKRKAKFVLELAAGDADVGDEIEFE